MHRGHPAVWPDLATLLLCCALLATMSGTQAGTIDDWIRSFTDSQIEFQRSTSNLPFVPLAFAEVSYYNDAEIRVDKGRALSFDQTTVSQAVGLPFLISPRDVVVIGEWTSWSEFRTRSSAFESFDVISIGIPVGWLRQVNPDWQAAAFVMPLASKASLNDASWSWQYMGGAFARYVQSDTLWWAFGLFVNVAPGEDSYLPYLGASWELNDQWMISAVMPWPAVLYAPTKDTLFRFGAAPSGASWAIRPDDEKVAFELDSWDLGISAEHRVHGNLWLTLEAGVGGLRGLRVTEGRWQGPEIDLGSSPYVALGINFRPAILQ